MLLNGSFDLNTKFIEVQENKRMKQLVLEPGVRKTFLLSSCTPLGYSLTSCQDLIYAAPK